MNYSTLIKTNEIQGEIIYETDLSEREIREKFQSLVASRTVNKNPFYYLRHPFYFAKRINYFKFQIKQEYVYIRRGFNVPPIYIYFENRSVGKTAVRFSASYLRLAKWIFFFFLAFGGYQSYQQFMESSLDKVTLLTIALWLIVCLVVTGVTFGQEKLTNYYFKRSVEMIVNDINS